LPNQSQNSQQQKKKKKKKKKKNSLERWGFKFFKEVGWNARIDSCAEPGALERLHLARVHRLHAPELANELRLALPHEPVPRQHR
jgi:hypothetical protein